MDVVSLPAIQQRFQRMGTKMCVKYSFIVDESETFYHQASIFLKTITACGVSPSDIICRFTPNTPDRTRDVVRSFGVELLEIEPFLDRRYCNKINQLNELINLKPETVVLCDTDLAFLDPLTSLFGCSQVQAKLVDGPNPSIDVLENIRLRAGYTNLPRIVEIDGRGAFTYSVNCNGGLYIIPGALARHLAMAWRAEAISLFDSQLLPEPWKHQVDQVSFAMAMLFLGQDVKNLPVEFNFPLNQHKRLQSLRAGTPKIIHYHDHMLDDEKLIKLVGDATVDEAISRVNHILQKDQKAL